jgi:hypothetical protein
MSTGPIARPAPNSPVTCAAPDYDTGRTREACSRWTLIRAWVVTMVA